MARISKKGDKNKYDIRDKDCIGMPCLKLHPIQVRGATSYGSRSTGTYRYACATRDYRGCPQPIPGFDKDLAKERRKDGMKVVY